MKNFSLIRQVASELGYIFCQERWDPSKHFLFLKTSSRRFQEVFSVTLFVFQDLWKTSSRRLQDVFAIRLHKMSSRRLQDVFARRLAIMSLRRLQYVLEDKKTLHWRRLEDVFKTSSVRLHQEECLLGYLFLVWVISEKSQ